MEETQQTESSTNLAARPPNRADRAYLWFTAKLRRYWWPTGVTALAFGGLTAIGSIGDPWPDIALMAGLSLLITSCAAVPRLAYLRKPQCRHCGGDVVDCARRLYLEAPQECMSEIGR